MAVCLNQNINPSLKHKLNSLLHVLHIRIVKMSSPNLNILTLAGSVLTYSSGFLFAVGEHRFSKEGAPTAVLQVSVPFALLDSLVEES